MRKVFVNVCLIMALCCIGIIMPKTISNAEEQDGYQYSVIDDDSVKITGYTYDNSTVLNIPSEIDGKKVTVIGARAFVNHSEIVTVVIPDSITTIEDSAFYYCTGIEELVIPSNVTTVGDSAFYWCSGLAKLTIEDGVSSIGTYAFVSCKLLNEVILPSSVKFIGEGAFASCKLVSAIVPSSVTNIGLYVFADESSNFVLYCNKGSYAETYAGSNYLAKKYTLDLCEIDLSATSYVYDGLEKEPVITVKDGDYTLIEDTDYTLDYYANTDAGVAKVTIAGINDYVGNIDKEYEITAKSISKAKVTLSANAYICDGLAKEPTVTVKDGAKTLVKGTDYTVKYSANKVAGKATVTITGKNNYSGTITKTFTIEAKRDYYNIKTDGGSWNGVKYVLKDTKITNVFFCDGTYTYYLQADGTPMKNRLTYHPDGVHLIYFDDKGHELFDQFQYCADVGYTCYFDTFGYLYKDVITFSNGKAYYLDGTGKMKQNEYFKFDNGLDLGHATADGSLENGGFGYDQFGRVVFYHWNGMIARGLITDGAWYYDLDTTDGHLIGQFAAN